MPIDQHVDASMPVAAKTMIAAARPPSVGRVGQAAPGRDTFMPVSHDLSFRPHLAQGAAVIVAYTGMPLGGYEAASAAYRHCSSRPASR